MSDRHKSIQQLVASLDMPPADEREVFIKLLRAAVRDLLAEIDSALPCVVCGTPSVTALDGERLCLDHANEWVRAAAPSGGVS